MIFRRNYIGFVIYLYFFQHFKQLRLCPTMCKTKPVTKVSNGQNNKLPNPEASAPPYRCTLALFTIYTHILDI